jgi:molybdenum cofactor cytidylyltransferase
MRFATIILAAGKSSRMGRNKLLIAFNDIRVIDRLIDVFEKTVDKIVIVTGYEPEKISDAVRFRPVTLVHNPDFESEMIISVKTGFAKLHDVDAAFLVPGDQLGVSVGLLEKMRKIMIDDDGALIVSPVYRGKRGHPILIRSTLFKEILSLRNGMTLRGLIDRYESCHRFVEGSEWSVKDFDTPTDLEEAKKYWRS